MMRRLTAICLAWALWATGAQAQTWSNPNESPAYGSPPSGAPATDDTRIQEFTKALQDLLDKGERERLADPWFLKDLRDLANKYHRPWTRLLLSDDFSARGTAPQAPWRIASGEFRVNWRYGLRSLAVPPRRQASSTANAGQNQQGDAVQQLFGALLNQALKGARQDERQAPSQDAATADTGQPAEILAPLAISNAFSVEIDVTARPLAGTETTRFALGVYQGQKQAGYRLIARSDGAAGPLSLRLIRVNGRGGAAIIEQADAQIRLDPERPVRLVWTRAPSGDMQVAVEGQPVLRIVDRGFRDPFDGFLIRNRSGDIAVRRIRIDGV